MVPPSHGSDLEQEQGEPDVPPEDEEFFDTPDADAMEKAISKFVNGLEQQERRGFTKINTYLQLWNLLHWRIVTWTSPVRRGSAILTGCNAEL